MENKFLPIYNVLAQLKTIFKLIFVVRYSVISLRLLLIKLSNTIKFQKVFSSSKKALLFRLRLLGPDKNYHGPVVGKRWFKASFQSHLIRCFKLNFKEFFKLYFNHHLKHRPKRDFKCRLKHYFKLHLKRHCKSHLKSCLKNCLIRWLK